MARPKGIPAWNRTHGKTPPRLYSVWQNMKTRCYNPNNVNWRNYGGRGIGVCDDWQTYEAFRDWAIAAGYKNDLTIERIDNDGDYSPENCIWTSRATQSRNKRNNRWITAFGETKVLADWMRDERYCGISRSSLIDRLRVMPPEQALTMPRTDTRA